MRGMRMRGLHSATGHRVRRSLALTLVAGGALVGFSACSSSPEEKAPENPLAAVKWEPSFEPDYVNLTPVPGVEAATKEEQEQRDRHRRLARVPGRQGRERPSLATRQDRRGGSR